MHIKRTLSLLMLIGLILSGCSKVESDDLIGTWRHSYPAYTFSISGSSLQYENGKTFKITDYIEHDKKEKLVTEKYIFLKLANDGEEKYLVIKRWVVISVRSGGVIRDEWSMGTVKKASFLNAQKDIESLVSGTSFRKIKIEKISDSVTSF